MHHFIFIHGWKHSIFGTQEAHTRICHLRCLRDVRSSDSQQVTLIDIRTCDLTLSQVMKAVRLFAFALPEHEIFMDDDAYAIVARAHANATSTKGALN